MYHSTALVEVPRNLAPLNVVGTWQGAVPEPWLKSMGTCCTSAQRRVLRNVLAQCAVATQHEQSIVCLIALAGPCFTIRARAPIPYVQAAILNLLNPY